MNSRDAARRVIHVLRQRLSAGRINGPSRRIEDAWVSRETTGAFNNGIAIVIDSRLDQKWVGGQLEELIKMIRHEQSMNRARRGLHIWNGDKVSGRCRDYAQLQEALQAMDNAEVWEGLPEALHMFSRKTKADQIIVLTTVEKLVGSDKSVRFPARKMSVIFPAGEGERDTYKIKGIPCFGVQMDPDDQEGIRKYGAS